MNRQCTIAPSLLLSVLLLAGCPGKSPETGVGRSGLTGVYEAEFRHEDGSRTRITVQMKADTTFRIITGAIGRFEQADEYIDDFGRWAPVGDDIVRLSGGGTAHRFRVFTNGTLRILNEEGEEPADGPPQELVRISDEAVADISPPPMVLEGMFSSMADAGRFFDCARGAEFPVARAGENARLEAEYSALKTAPHQRIYVRLEGFYRTRYGMEEGRLERALVPSRFLGFDTTMQCR